MKRKRSPTPAKVGSRRSAKQEYEVSAIVDERNGEFLVRWAGYDSSNNTWEPASALPAALVQKFRKRRASERKPALHKLKTRAKSSAKTNKARASKAMDDIEYEVEALLDDRQDRQFLVSWVGFSQRTWEPEDVLPVTLVKRYRENKKKSQGLTKDDQEYEVEALLDARQDGKFLVSWVGFSKRTWEPGDMLPVALVKQYRENKKRQQATKDVTPQAPVDFSEDDVSFEAVDEDDEQSDSTEANVDSNNTMEEKTILPALAVDGVKSGKARQLFSANVCGYCGDSDGVDRACETCNDPLHLHCSNNVAVSLSIFKDGALTTFKNGCFCSKECYQESHNKPCETDGSEYEDEEATPKEACAEVCVTCGESGGVGRKCETCRMPMHHFCSNDVAVLLGIVNDSAKISEFGNICYCSKECYYGRVGSTKKRL
jgi:Chromo (CHRromatin Organisation MOdifier) domain